MKQVKGIESEGVLFYIKRAGKAILKISEQRPVGSETVSHGKPWGWIKGRAGSKCKGPGVGTVVT